MGKQIRGARELAAPPNATTHEPPWSLDMRLAILTLALTLGCVTPQPPQEEPLELVGAPNTQAPPAAELPPAPTPKARPKRAGALWYRIVHKGNHLDVSLRLLSPPKRTSFFLPGPWAGRDDHAKHLSIQGARTPQGPLPVTLHRGDRRLDLETKQAPWVELHYRVSLQHRRNLHQRFSPQRLGQGYFAYAPTFLVLPSAGLSDQMERIPVEIHAPTRQKVVTTWTQSARRTAKHNASHTVHGFVVQDIQSLRDAFVAVSDSIDITSPERDLQVAFDQRFQGDRPGILANIQAILRSYRARFGSVGPISVLVRAPGRRSERMLWGTGRRRGFVLELEPRAKLNDNAKILIAHEAFHLWNGHLLVPRAKDEEKTRWFKEGSTHYVAIQTLHMLGLLSEARVLTELAQAATRYARNPARLGHSASTLERRQLPYDRGVLLTLALETELVTQRAGSIDHWLRRLLARARAQPGWMYDERALGQELQALTNAPSLRTLWSGSVERARTLRLPEIFGRIGLHWLAPTRRRPGKLIALEDHAPLYRSILRVTSPKPAESPHER